MGKLQQMSYRDDAAMMVRIQVPFALITNGPHVSKRQHDTSKNNIEKIIPVNDQGMKHRLCSRLPIRFSFVKTALSKTNVKIIERQQTVSAQEAPIISSASLPGSENLMNVIDAITPRANTA